jgi:hypothetical protein
LPWNALPLKMKALRSFGTSRVTYPTTESHPKRPES